MVKYSHINSIARFLAGGLAVFGLTVSAAAQESLPWQRNAPTYSGSGQSDTYRQAQGTTPDPYRSRGSGGGYQSPAPTNRYDYGQGRQGAYAPPPQSSYGNQRRGERPVQQPRYVQPYRPAQPDIQAYPRRYGANEPYNRNYGDNARGYDDNYDRGRGSARIPEGGGRGTYSENEVVDAGHRFFGSLSTGLAKAIQWAFKRSGRPNGYILGEDAGGAFVAGLRYGEGKLYTKDYGVRRIFWQGPSIGYDFGGDGNRTMTLVYNLRSPGDVYRRFGGVQGAAYLVGGVSVQLLTADDITLAPIRTGVGLRLGANIGYLKYTRRPTWNPF